MILRPVIKLSKLRGVDNMEKALEEIGIGDSRKDYEVSL